jgi:hypothetical protein
MQNKYNFVSVLNVTKESKHRLIKLTEEGRVNQIIGRTPTEKMEKIQLIGK